MNLLGDPELSIYTDVPVSMNVTHLSTITTGNSNFNVSVSGFPPGEDVKVCLSKGNEVHASTESSTGSVTLNICPDTPGDMQLTVTCHNAEPYDTIINVIQNTGVHLYENGFTITDENGNGFIEPGETIDLNIDLSNSGTISATNIIGTLSQNGCVVITQDTSTYPDIPSMQAQTSNVNYSFNVITYNISYGKVIPFELDISTDQGQFHESFFLNLKTKKLDIGDRIVTVNGIETNDFNLGDNAELFLDVFNYGAITAPSIKGVLRTTLLPNIVSIDTVPQDFGDINSFKKATNSIPFTFTIGPDYSGGQLDFYIILTDEFGIMDVFYFDVTEDLPPKISGFDFSSGKNDITISWTKINNIKGYNVYRSDDLLGVYEKINNFIVSGASMYYDTDVDELSEYYKVSVISNTGKERQLDDLDTYLAWTTLPRHDDYPIEIAGSFANKNITSVTVADIDGDDLDELFPAFIRVRDGLLMGFDETGQELFDIDGDTTTISGFAKIVLPVLNGSTDGGELWSEPSVGDVDNDGIAEVFVTTSGNHYATDRGYLLGFNTVDLVAPNNQPDPLWNGIPKDLGYRSFSSPVLADLDGNGTMEIIAYQEQQKVSVFSSTGSLLWDLQIDSTGSSYGYLAVADLNGDGPKEIIMGTRNPGAIYILNHDGTDYNNSNPKYIDTTYRFDANPVIANIDNDNELEIIITGRIDDVGSLFAFDTDGSFVSDNWDGDISLNFITGEYTDHLTPQAAIGDLNNDGFLEIAIADNSKLYVFDNNGNDLQGFPVSIPSLNCGRSSPLLADIDSDDDIEIIITASNDRIYAFNPDGTECVGWRLSSKCTGGFVGTPTIADINNDGFNEIIISDAECKTHVWKTTGDADKIGWGCYRANTQNTGEYKTECQFINSKTQEISGSNVIWDTYKHMQGNLIIKSGASLTILSTVTFVNESKVIVEPGAKLILDGCLLTNYGCYNNTWQGIVVQGDPTKSQIPESNQGVLEISSGGTIANAKIAVNVMGTQLFKGGGIVRIDNAVFRNNARSILMWKYRNFVPSSNTTIPNVSYIKNCHFEITDNNLLDTITPFFIYLWEVDGIKLLANTFIDTSGTTDPARRADGILSYDASFYVDPVCMDAYTPCDDWKKNHFEGLNYGIRVMNSNPDRTLSVSTAEFENVYRGIFLNGVSNATIILNEFETPDINTTYSSTYSDPYSDKEPYGIYLNECNAYTVEENLFESSSSNGYTTETYGIIINNSHEPPNEIYKNDFDDLECGILAVNDNRSIPGQQEFTGLKLKCNNITSTYKDIDVRSSSPYGYTAKGLSEYQGYDNGLDATAPAGNRFTQNCSPGFFFADFDNNRGLYLIYYHHNGDAANGDRWVPMCYSVDNMLLEPVSVPFTVTSACPSNFDNGSGGLSISELYSELDATLQQKNSSFLIYNIWKDGGNTEQLELEVELAMPPESYELYNELISESPYLSDDVLMAAIENEDVLTSLMIKLIMIANPQSTRSDDVMDALYSRLNPLPESWIDEIISGTAYASQLEKLEATYSHNNHEYKMTLNDLKSRFLQDTIFSWKKDSLFNLLSQQDDLYSQYELAFFRLKNEDTTTMDNILDNIPFIFELNEELESNHQDYFNILNIFKTMKTDSISIFDLDSITIDTLESIASTCLHYPSAWANAILEQRSNDIEDRYREVIPDDPGGSQRIEAPYRNVSPEEVHSQLKVYPNPARNYIALEYDILKPYNKIYINITDIAGKIVYSKVLIGQKSELLIDITEFKPGFYMVNLLGDGKIIKSEKLSKLK